MNTTELKQLLDACFLAKHLVETLPALPDGMKPRHIHVLDAIYETNRLQDSCRVSDVCARLRITMPSVTRLIQELESMDMVIKYADMRDKRVTLLKLTDRGLDCVQRHVLDFHRRWAQRLPEMNGEQIQETVSVIQKLYAAMPDLE